MMYSDKQKVKVRLKEMNYMKKLIQVRLEAGVQHIL